MARTVSRRAKRVWERLASWYGSRLAEQYGENPPEDWCAVFDRTDDERLDAALSSVRHASPIHPPTLGQIENALPRAEQRGSPSRAAMAYDAMLQAHGRDLCQHQRMRPWNYFGPSKEFVSKQRGGELVQHPEIRGVQVAACAKCDKPSYRALIEDMVSEGVAA
jgi:hypothetical protein